MALSEAPFLEQIVAHINAEYLGKNKTVCLVVPSRRARVFIKNHFKNKATTTTFLPAVLSIEEFVTELSDYQKIDNLELLFEFYNCYKQAIKEPQSFSEFQQWAPTLLQDFNEVDQYLVNSNELFGYINETRAIEVWNVDGKELTDFQKNYLDFWEQLLPLYSALHKRLNELKKAYQGYIFREVAENKTFINHPLIQDNDTILFAGFNALSSSEESIIDQLHFEKKCEVIWDADDYYTKNKAQEAGLFLRRFLGKWNSKQIGNPNSFGTVTKNIQCVEVSGNINQAKVAGNLLANANQNDTAVVLADEQLLQPVLNSLPSSIDTVNITMGLPMQKTPVFQLFALLFQLHDTSTKPNREGAFYHKYLVELLKHPSLANYDFKDIERKIIKANLSYVTQVEIQEISPDLFKDDLIRLLFDNWQNSAKNALNYLIEITLKLKSIFQDDAITFESLYAHYTVFNHLLSLEEKYGEIADIGTLKLLFNQVIGKECVAFKGEPLKGLQLMGMLETRTLDFKNIILLGVNEGVLPAGKTQNSFIPFDIKRTFQLPTHVEKDAIFAYHFYRLIQRAENVHLVYNVSSEDFGRAEKSRFVFQLENELEKYNPTSKVNHTFLNLPLPATQKEVPTVSSDKNGLEVLLKYAHEKGISPSALNAYINCPLDFYFKYGLKLKEPSVLEETIEANTLGTCVHDTLEELYQPFLQKILRAEDVAAMKPKVEKIVKDKFLRDFKASEISTGKNFLILKVANRFVQNFLSAEIKELEKLAKENTFLIIIGLEKKICCDIKVGEHTLKLSGSADRIDKIGDSYRIVDYKTGDVQPNSVSIKEMELVTTDKKYSKAFQLLLYAYIYRKMNVIGDSALQSGNISFRRLSEYFMPVKVGKNETFITPEIIDEFEQVLIQLLTEVFQLNRNFAHNEESTYCNFCDI